MIRNHWNPRTKQAFELHETTVLFMAQVDFCLAKHQSLRNGQGDRILSPNFKGPMQRNADEECTCEEPSGLHSMCFNAFFHRKYLENYCDLFCMAATV